MRQQKSNWINLLLLIIFIISACNVPPNQTKESPASLTDTYTVQAITKTSAAATYTVQAITQTSATATPPIRLSNPRFSRTIEPDLPKNKYINTVSQEGASYIFEYVDDSSKIQYIYTPSNGSLNDLRIRVGNEPAFLLSNFGGPIFVLGETEIPIWNAGSVLNFSHKTVSFDNESLLIDWVASNELASFEYSYKFSIIGKTLHLSVSSKSPNISQFTFDRTEETPGAYIASIPYMTNFNVLVYKTHFITAFFDWTNSHASGFDGSNAAHSGSSIYFGQNVYYRPDSNGKRNLLNETAYITVSDVLEEVFPNIPNDPSPYKQLMAKTVVVDVGEDDSFLANLSTVKQFKELGVKDLLFIKHVWQNCGYDDCLPSVIPANQYLGGDRYLNLLGVEIKNAGYLFGLHENYVDIYENSNIWSPNLIAIDSDKKWIPAWFNQYTKKQSYLLRPSKVINVASLFSPIIHNNYLTSSIYLDVHSAANPMDKVDYNASLPDAAQMMTTYKEYSKLFEYERIVHSGPVLGEGRQQILYAGRIDSVEGQYQDDLWDESTIPPIVDFDLLKIHPLMVTYGIGDLPRFFPNKSTYNTSDYDMYLSTEIAFCHAGYIFRPAKVGGLEEAKRQIDLIRPIQEKCALADVLNIQYYVDGEFVNVEKAILKKQPWQVYVEYSSGLRVYVNRDSKKNWEISPNSTQSWVDYNAIVNGIQNYYVGNQTSDSYTIPPNGWLAYLP